MVFKTAIAIAAQAIRAQAQYRASWLSEALWALGFTVSTFAFWRILAERFSLPGWSDGRIYVFLAFVELYWGLSRGVFAGTRELGPSIYTGDLDRYLVRPMDARLYLIASKFELIPSVRGAALFVVWLLVAASQGQSLDFRWVAAAVVVCTMGTLCFVALFLALGTFAFYLERIDALDEIVGSTFDTARYPIDIMHMALAGIFTYLLPAAAVATWPALTALEGRVDAVQFLVLIVLLVAWLAIAEHLWRRGLIRYESAASR